MAIRQRQRERARGYQTSHHQLSDSEGDMNDGKYLPAPAFGESQETKKVQTYEPIMSDANNCHRNRQDTAGKICYAIPIIITVLILIIVLYLYLYKSLTGREINSLYFRAKALSKNIDDEDSDDLI
eukprot:jgi/Bigna1/135747/aug1.30_g10455